MKIFLIGFMGSGKSTIGQLISQQLGYVLYDTDAIIIEKTGHSVADIFKYSGETVFREYESSILQNIVSRQENAAIATGGGMPCYNRQMNLMNTHGITVYLKLSSNHLYNRLQKSYKERPLLARQENLFLYIHNLLQIREPIYGESKYTLDISDEETPDDTLRRLLKLIGLPPNIKKCQHPIKPW